MVGKDIGTIVKELLAQGKNPVQIRSELSEKGFSTDDIATVLSKNSPGAEKGTVESRNNALLTTREILDRVGYGAVPPQFINILLWIALQTNGLIFLVIGIVTGLRTIISVIVSSILQEYHRLHKISAKTIAGAGILFGFSFFLMAMALLLRNIPLIFIATIIGTVALVVYGDSYQGFLHELVRRERMSAGLRRVAHWGVLITSGTMIFTAYLLEKFPMKGVPVTLAGMDLHVYGYLLAFMICAFAFILGGHITSFINDTREARQYPFGKFFKEHWESAKAQKSIFWSSKSTLLLTIAGLVFGLLQIVINAYSGIAIYKLLDLQYDMPFLMLGFMFAIAIVASFTGPFFTQMIHRSTGLAPTLVFGTILTAILPLMLWFSQNIVILTVALCLNVIGTAIVAFGQGLLAQQLMDDTKREEYFKAQPFVLLVPYILLVPALAWFANSLPLAITFLYAAIGTIVIVVPIYFILVLMGEKTR